MLSGTTIAATKTTTTASDSEKDSVPSDKSQSEKKSRVTLANFKLTSASLSLGELLNEDEEEVDDEVGGDRDGKNEQRKQKAATKRVPGNVKENEMAASATNTRKVSTERSSVRTPPNTKSTKSKKEGKGMIYIYIFFSNDGKEWSDVKDIYIYI